MRRKIFLLFLACIFFFGGCGNNVDSFTTFSTQGFGEFFDFRTTLDMKETYIRNGKFEFAKLNDFYVCPFIKEINYDKCGLFFYIYTLEEKYTETIKISDIVLSTDGGEKILYTNSDKQTVWLDNNDKSILIGKLSGIEFEKAEDWFWDNNSLELTFEVECSSGKVDARSFSYDIKIISNERVKLPT